MRQTKQTLDDVVAAAVDCGSGTYVRLMLCEAFDCTNNSILAIRFPVYTFHDFHDYYVQLAVSQWRS